MQFKLDIVQKDNFEDIYTEIFPDLRKLILAIFEEWKGMGWVNDASLQTEKARYLIRFFVDINSCYENKHIVEIINIEELNQTINIIFNSFCSGYEKTYRIERYPMETKKTSSIIVN